jgi:hypothetical protein
MCGKELLKFWINFGKFFEFLEIGLTTKARGYKVTGYERSLAITPHAFGNVGKCEGMNPHTSKRASTLGVGVPTDSRIFKEQFQGSKLNGLNNSLYH